MTAEQVTDTLVLPSFADTIEAAPLVRTSADRQDARRRAAVAACDAIAAVATAGGLGWLLDSLPLQQALVVPAGWTLAAWGVGAYHRRRLKIRLGDVRALLVTTVTLWAVAAVVTTLVPLSGTRALILAAVPATAVAVALTRIGLRRFTRVGEALAAAPLVLYGSQDTVRRFSAAARRERR